ncbi:MAG: carbohydrate ABC transporter permease [Chloroflexi bacterium]|nr:carbohydrate ABC transporter permease [Chloroflexota bacterium]
MEAQRKNPVAMIAINAVLILWLVYSVTPFLWTMLNSLKTPREANSRIPVFPFDPTGDNYAELWLNNVPDNLPVLGFILLLIIIGLIGVGLLAPRFPIPRVATYSGIVAVGGIVVLVIPSLVNTAEFYDYFINSVIVTVGTVVISITIGCLAGYGLARYRGIIGVVILFAALAFRALPRMAFVLPYYYLGQAVGLYDTHLLLILTLVAVNQPFTVWMLRSFFMDIPHEVEEAAMIDGCTRLQAFTRVIIPIMWPGIITTALFTLLLAYNEFLLARILMQSNWTLPVALSSYTGGEDASQLTLAAAGSVSITLPIVFVIIFFQKYLVKGLAFGAVKG